MPTDGQRPQRREEQAPHEIITKATMEINTPEEQQKAAVGAALDAPRGGKTQLPKIRTAITAEQIAGTRLPPAAHPRLIDGQRPPRREEQAPQETTTIANMNINRPEEHQEAESRQPPINLPLDTDCATQVAMLFGNLATRNRATGVDLRRNREFRNPIRALGPKLRVYTSTHNVQAVTRRAPIPAAAAPAGVSRAGLATNTGSDAKLVAASITHLYGREKIATDHHPAPPATDQSAMHHGQLP
eukprot:jgi/Tetstr1/455905/TSEL_042686.t1